MRYYSLEVTNADGTTYPADSPVWTTLDNNRPQPNAPLIEFDIPVFALGTPIGAAAVKIWGVSTQLIEQATDFAGKSLTLRGGMQKGLPLANPAQQGVLLQGLIDQSYGNWIGTDQWLQFIVTSDGSEPDIQPNLTFSCHPGQLLADVIQATLGPAYPKFKPVVNISPDLIVQELDVNVSYTMTQFAQYIKMLSQQIIGGSTYPGVSIVFQQNTIQVFDGVAPPSSDPVVIDFKDLVGQPTWIDPGTVQIITVLRGDLGVNDRVTLPPVAGIIAPSSAYVAPRDRSIFQGTFVINEMRHLGNSRQPDAASWVTVFNLSPVAP